MRVLVVVMFLLAGCVSVSDEPIEWSETSQDLDVAFQGCTGSVAFSLQPFSSADKYLPPGFHAEDASHFFSATAGVGLPNLNQALFGLIITDCTLSHTGLQEYIAVAWILLESPRAEWEEDPADFEWYELFRYTNGPSLPDSLAQFHWEAEVGNISTAQISNPPYLAARYWQLGEPAMFTMSHEGSGVPIDASGQHRTWSQHQNGTTTYEFDLEAQLLLGPGICTGNANHWSYQFLGGSCTDLASAVSPNTQFAAFTGLELAGHFHFEKDGFVS